MRVATYSVGGTDRIGVLDGEQVIDLDDAPPHTDLKTILNNGGFPTLRQRGRGSAHALEDVVFQPVIRNPGKIIAVGINYEEHRSETGRDKSAFPMIFVRFADAQVGHMQPMVKPHVSEMFDYEGELAVIIGKQ